MFPAPVSSRPSAAQECAPVESEAFILALAQALHTYGVSAHRLEGMLTLVALRLGLEARFYSTPTAVMVSFGEVTAARTCLVRVDPGAMDLEKMCLLHEITVRVIHGEVGVAEGRARTAEIVRTPARYGVKITLLAFALSSGAAAVFFGGGPLEVGVSLLVGLGVGVVCRASDRWSSGFSIAEPLAAAFAAVAAAFAARSGAPMSTLVITLAGVVTLLPGLGITTAMTELATRNLASGTARFSGALVQLLGLGFGVALGARLVALMPIAAATPPPATAWSPLALAAAVVISGLSFSTLLRVRPRDVGWVVLACGLAFAGTRLGAMLLGPELGAFLGALLLGLASNGFARAFDRPAALPLVPGLLVLVPGSVGFRSVFALLDNDVLSGVNAAFKMMMISVALVSGVLFASVAIPPRRAL
jgi:uncharacterized membrane protein YjjP (DUF1212 family)